MLKSNVVKILMAYPWIIYLGNKVTPLFLIFCYYLSLSALTRLLPFNRTLDFPPCLTLIINCGGPRNALAGAGGASIELMI